MSTEGARIDAKTGLVWAFCLTVAALGGYLALLAGLPLPWLLGAMLASALVMASGVRILGRPLSFPQLPRMMCVAIIGVAIGGTTSPAVWAEIPHWWPSLCAVLIFVLLAHAVNYQIFRRLAGYDRPTAYYCATPGGLIESVQLGEEVGGNPALLTVQHFSRITLTVVLVPFIYWAMRGEAVGSAAGVSMDLGAEIGWLDAVLLGGCAVIGAWGGRRVKFPAAIITGPIILSSLVHGTGMTAAQPPDWLIAVAQLVIGLGLAMRFRGLSRQLLVQGMGLGLLTVVVMLCLGATVAAAVSLVDGHPFQVLLMCFAPGGVVEMGLIALSLGVSPMIVTLHHILRIGVTVVVIPLIGQRFLAPAPEEGPS